MQELKKDPMKKITTKELLKRKAMSNEEQETVNIDPIDQMPVKQMIKHMLGSLLRIEMMIMEMKETLPKGSTND